mmetsp:Transcript_30536/g.54604  ORF Transcript_30536/g.54604 Transcript_30536/m.54604 type:complete len:260 (-) Transcript_30536:111-890(-)
MSSKRLKRPMVSSPGFSGAASCARSNSSFGIIMAASSTSSSMVRIPSKPSSTCLKSLWFKLSMTFLSSATMFHLCAKAAMKSTSPFEQNEISRVRSNFSLICSATVFPSRPPACGAGTKGVGLQAVFANAWTSAMSAAKRTYLTALSWPMRHLSIRAFLSASIGASSASLRFFAAGSEAAVLPVLSMRFRWRLPSTASRMSSGTRSSSKSSSRKLASSSSAAASSSTGASSSSSGATSSSPSSSFTSASSTSSGWGWAG